MSFCDVSYCINLDRRPDRWEEFQRDWPSEQLGPVERSSAIDGNKCPPPRWWTAGRGAWGCMRSHLATLERALSSGAEIVGIFEDDAVPVRTWFTERFAAFTAALPRDWGMIYFGGRLVKPRDNPPYKVNDWCLAPYGCETTHAYALRGRMLAEVYQYLCQRDWQVGHHIDHRLAHWHRGQRRGVYVPAYWLFDQRGGKSNVSGRQNRHMSWSDPIEYAPV